MAIRRKIISELEPVIENEAWKDRVEQRITTVEDLVQQLKNNIDNVTDIIEQSKLGS